MSVHSRWESRLATRQRLLASARKAHEAHPTKKTKKLLEKRKGQVSYAKRVLARHPEPSLRELALTEARKLVGVMEEGGNNRGAAVEKIIKANGGVPGEPWCGDGMAYCYIKAGSKAVTRSWASVRLLSGLSGIKKVKDPLPGNLVRFTFDHVGMFVRRINATTIETIEFNTGATGAVSDSKTGGDGVYVKRRDISLVKDYLRVTR